MRRAAFGANGHTHCAFRSARETTFRWLTIYERGARRGHETTLECVVRGVRTVVTGLLSHDEQQPHWNRRVAQALSGADH